MAGNLRFSENPIGAPPAYLGQEEPDGFWEDFRRHKLVRLTDKKQRQCLMCKTTRRRTAGGSLVLTRHQCGLCEVYLCKGERGCFVHYHQILYRNGGVTDSPGNMVAEAFGIPGDSNKNSTVDQ